MASMSFTRPMPSASTARTWSGSLRPAMRASRPGDQALQDQGRLAGSGHPGDHGEPPLGDVRLQGLHRVDGPGGQMDAPLPEQLFLMTPPPYWGLGLSGQKGPDLGGGVRRHVGNRPLGQYPAALRPRLGSHLDEPVGVG